MIQELLGGAGIIEEDRKFSISTLDSSPSLSPSSSTITATAAAAAAVPASSSASAENQTLRCPRCNSSNTKFCYYNNYNLTQPRHFCKTCRRYWTKGGALRNVPIGGGCRKNKNVSVTSVAKSSPGRLKNVSAEIGKAGGLVGGFDQELPSNPAPWASLPQNSQFLALLRATQNPNPNPNPISVKEETVMIGSHLASNSMGRTLGLDLFNQDPGSFFWRNNQHQAQQQQQQQQQNNHHHHHHHHHHQHHQQQTGFILGEVQNSQEIYQRLRTIPNYYNPDHHSPLLLSNVASSSSSTILDSAPASATELGHWNPALPWSDLPTSNGAYP